MTFDCPDSSTSQRERREEQQPEHDSVANRNIFSTGNGSEPLWSGQEQKNTFLLTERRQIQAGNFLTTTVIKALRQFVINTRGKVSISPSVSRAEMFEHDPKQTVSRHFYDSLLLDLNVDHEKQK